MYADHVGPGHSGVDYPVWFHVQLLHATRCNNCRHSNTALHVYNRHSDMRPKN